jgi:hypothetical protein
MGLWPNARHESVDGVAPSLGRNEQPRRVCSTPSIRGLIVGALVAAGYQVFAVNPKAVDRYRPSR